MKTLTSQELSAADAGSYYTILGAGGPLEDWVSAYEKLLEENEVGKPTEWFQTTGASVNLYATRVLRGPIAAGDEFQEDLTILMFPLGGLNVSHLVVFKVIMGDRWFDDIIANMAPADD